MVIVVMLLNRSRQFGHTLLTRLHCWMHKKQNACAQGRTPACPISCRQIPHRSSLSIPSCPAGPLLSSSFPPSTGINCCNRSSSFRLRDASACGDLWEERLCQENMCFVESIKRGRTQTKRLNQKKEKKVSEREYQPRVWRIVLVQDLEVLKCNPSVSYAVFCSIFFCSPFCRVPKKNEENSP